MTTDVAAGIVKAVVCEAGSAKPPPVAVHLSNTFPAGGASAVIVTA